MDAVQAMDTVFEHINAGDIIGAQAVVIVMESERSVLPSSVFTRVLRAAAAADCLTPEYVTFCQRAYGKGGFLVELAEAFQAAVY